MKYSNRNIKKYTKKLVLLKYYQKDMKTFNSSTGEITAFDRDGILFNINRLPRKEGLKNLHLEYNRIININKPEK